MGWEEFDLLVLNGKSAPLSPQDTVSPSLCLFLKPGYKSCSDQTLVCGERDYISLPTFPCFPTTPSLPKLKTH